MFQTIQSALASITDASETKRYVVSVAPGIYELGTSGGPVLLKSYVTLVGADQQSTLILTEGTHNIRASSFSRIERLTVLGSGHPVARGAIETAAANLTDFQLNDVLIGITGSGAALTFRGHVARAEIRNSTIVTSATGIAVRAGGHVYVHDTNIHLTGFGADHIGVLARSYCRIYLFGGKIGTGYGYPAVSNPGEPVIGVLFESNGSGRIVMQGVWSICRNDGAPTGVAVNCLRVEGPNGWIRVFGSYLQAENPTGTAVPETISNPGLGRIELYGSRARNYGAGPVYSGQQIGRYVCTPADNNKVLDQGMGGAALLDAQTGGFNLYLPYLPVEGDQLIFKKIDTTTNSITISGNGRTIDGQPQVQLTTPYQVLSVRYMAGQYLIMP